MTFIPILDKAFAPRINSTEGVEPPRAPVVPDGTSARGTGPDLASSFSLDSVARAETPRPSVTERLRAALPSRRGYVSPVKASFDPETEVKAIEAGLKGEGGPWARLHGKASPDRFTFNREQAKIASTPDADRLLVTYYDELLRGLESSGRRVTRFHRQMAGDVTPLKERVAAKLGRGKGVDTAMTAEERRFAPTYYEYARFNGVRKGKTEADFDDNRRAMNTLAGQRGVRGLWAKAQAKLTGKSPRAFNFNWNVFGISIKQSPWVDGGYDVSDYHKVQPELGEKKYGRFLRDMQKRRMSYSSDLVLNHVSREHPFARALRSGDMSKLPYFVDWTDAAKIGETTDPDGRVFNLLLHSKGADAGKVSRVWQIFPDSNPDSLVNVDVPGHGTVKLYASFMPEQWDLNVFNPDVFADHLSAVAGDLVRGSRGVRWDAIIHGGKEAGTDQINLPRIQAMAKLHKSFQDELAPGSIAIPEANLPVEQARNEWLLPSQKFEGKDKQTAGDALISFEAAKHAGSAPLAQSKARLSAFMASKETLPSNVTEWIAPAKSHDEFMPYEDVLEQLHDNGLPIFAGRGTGNSLLETTGNRPEVVRQIMMLSYMMGGTPIIKGTHLIPKGDDVAFHATQKSMRLAEMEKQGRPQDEVKASDVRDLDRGAVPLEDLQKALKDGYAPAVFVSAANKLWETRPAIRGRQISEIENGDDGVYSQAMVDAKGRDVPVLQLLNLTDAPKTLKLSAADVAQKLGWKNLEPGQLRDFLGEEETGKKQPVTFRKTDAGYEVDLAPRAAMWMDALGRKS